MTENSEVKSSASAKASIESFYSSGGVPKRTTYRQQRAEQQQQQNQQQSEGSQTGERSFKRTLKKQVPTFHESLESHLSNEANYIMYDTVEGFLNQLPKEDCNPQLFEKILLFLVMVLKSRQTVQFLEYLLSNLR